jgi:hypothetical protein
MNYRRSLPSRPQRARFLGRLLAVNAIPQAACSPVARGSDWRGWLPLLVLPSTMILLRSGLPAWAFMWALALAIFLSLKWLTWWAARQQIAASAGRSLAYLLAWPGMDAAAFLDQARACRQAPVREWLWAAAKTVFGGLLFWLTARRIPADYSLLRGWVGLVGLIFLLHFGSFHLLALFWQGQGIDARPIMSNPLAARSLSQFWGRRWNLGFHQLAHTFVFRPLQKHMGATLAAWAVFAASGLIHDLVISLPARGGYGLPTGYFLLQGLGVLFERSPAAARLDLSREWRGRCFTLCITAAPAFWLFHPPFIHRVVVPFMRAVRAL